MTKTPGRMPVAACVLPVKGRAMVRPVLAMALAVCLACTTTGRGADRAASPEDMLPRAVKQLRAAGKGQSSDAAIEDQIRYISWLLLVGQLAAHPEIGLSSGAIDALEGGLRRLDAVSQELAKNPTIEKRLTLPRPAVLAMRLDATRLRLENARATQKLSRDEEWERLKQLRELARAYRELTTQIAAMNTQFLLGDYNEVRQTNLAVSQKLEELRAVAARRRDFYLFQDEPKLEPTDNSEFKLITQVTAPVVHDLVSHFQSLQSLIAYRLATANRAGSDAKLLREASRLAEGLLSDPHGASLIPLYVHGLSQRDLGLLETAADPVNPDSHRVASSFFQRALTSLEKARDHIAAEPSTGKLLEGELERSIAHLSGPRAFLAEADRLTEAGKTADVHDLLLMGLRYHTDKDLLLALVRSDLRDDPGRLASARDLIRRAMAVQLLNGDDPSVLLLRGRLELNMAWDRISRGSVEKLSGRERAELLQVLRDGRGLLSRAQSAFGMAPARASASAYLALAFAYTSVLEPKDQQQEAKDLLHELPRLTSELHNRMKGAASSEQLAILEAIVAARLAEGFLAVRYLPAYRDEAMAAFAAAADAQARLPFEQAKIKLFGSPMLKALLDRPENQAMQLAQEERELRNVLGRFVQGAVSMRLGQPEAGAVQMRSALQQVAVTPQGQAAPVDAERILSQIDDVSSKPQLLAKVRCLTVLGLVAGKRYDEALFESLRPALPALEKKGLAALSVGDLSSIIERIDDPLASLSLGMALEEYAASQRQPRSARTRDFLGQATFAQERTAQLLVSAPLYADRFPDVVAMNRDALRRLKSADHYLEEGRKLRHDLRIAEATALLDNGARRHPDSPALTEELIRCQIDWADINPVGSKASLESALQRAEEAQQAGQFNDASSYLVVGELRERVGQPRAAFEAYKTALSSRPATAIRLKAESRLAALAATLGP